MRGRMDSAVFSSLHGLLPVSEFLESRSHSRSAANVKKQGDKMWELLRLSAVAAIVIDFTFVPVLTQCLSLNRWNLKIIRQVLKKMHVRVSLSLLFSHVNDIKYIIVQ